MKNTNRTENEKKRRSSRALGQRTLRIDESRLDQLAQARLTLEELAATLNVPTEQLERDYGERIRQAAARGNGMLRRKALEMALVDKNERMLCFLLTHGSAMDPQLRELQELHIRELHLRLKRMENEEQRAQLALEREKIELGRARLIWNTEQQVAAAQQERKSLAGLSSMSLEELEPRLERIRLELKISEMNADQRLEALRVIEEIMAQPEQGDLESHRFELLVRAQDPKDLTNIVRRFNPQLG